MRITRLTVPTAAVELAADRLWCAGARAVEELAVDPTTDTVELRSVLAADDQVSAQRLGTLPVEWQLSFVEADQSGSDEWRRHARPVDVNAGLTIAPAWHPLPDRSGLVVAIEPGTAFGLGDHPTTRLTAAVLDRLDLRAARVLDVGCGTGVLAIIAARRGANRVVGVDIAPAAVEATTDNAARNRVAVSVSTTPIAQIKDEFDVVVANILAPELIGMARELRRVTAATGRLIISGVLSGAYDHVLDALRPLQVVAHDDLEGWAAVSLSHPR